MNHENIADEIADYLSGAQRSRPRAESPARPNTIKVARMIEELFTEQAAGLSALGIEAYARQMSSEAQISIGLEVFGADEDAEFAIDLLRIGRGVEIDAALIGGDGRTLAAFGPTHVFTQAALEQVALRLVAEGRRLLAERFAPSARSVDVHSVSDRGGRQEG